MSEKRVIPCVDCSSPSVPGERFCAPCKKRFLAKLRDSGFLPRIPRPTAVRKNEPEVKNGEPSPWRENAVRALEDREEG